MSADEKAAIRRYYQSARKYHAITLGFADFLEEQTQLDLCKDFALIEKAVAKVVLTQAITTFCGVPIGRSCVGCLSGSAQHFEGLRYCYPGFTSTSVRRDVAQSALSKNSSSPVLLEYQLPPNFHAIPVDVLLGQGEEAEVLLLAKFPFVIDSSKVQADALHLKLRPTQ